MTEHGRSPETFLIFVPAVDPSPLQKPNPALGAARDRCPAARSSHQRARVRPGRAVLARLGLRRHFDERVRHRRRRARAETLGADLRPLPLLARSRRRRPQGRQVRASARHPRPSLCRHALGNDDRADLCREHPRGVPRRPGARKAATRPCRSRQTGTISSFF